MDQSGRPLPPLFLLSVLLVNLKEMFGSTIDFYTDSSFFCPCIRTAAPIFFNIDPANPQYGLYFMQLLNQT